jgi:RND family efflux transporter MFP subunit
VKDTKMSNLHSDSLPAETTAHVALEPRRPSKRAIVVIGFSLIALSAGAFAAGFLPRARVKEQVAAEAREAASALPVVNVAPVKRAAAESEVVLPASIQAVTEAPILARTDGYLKRRFVDIGNRVAAGQLLAEIDAPEIDEQVSQAAAAVEQARATVEQAKAAVAQARANEGIARVTAGRWANLLLKGAVSRQEHDVYQAQFQAQMANTQALDRARLAAEDQVAALQANYQRLVQLRSYREVRAPFAGVITMRNIDAGALISAGQTLLFRIAQDGAVRAYINVPQQYADLVQPGQIAGLEVSDLPGRNFPGRVVRSAEALDPSSRTLLVEVQVPNRDGLLLPGMYGRISLEVSRRIPPLTVPADCVFTGAEGSQVATVRRDGRVEFRRVMLGRDYGREIEVLHGLSEGDTVILNPGDSVRSGVRVQPRLFAPKGQ